MKDRFNIKISCYSGIDCSSYFHCKKKNVEHGHSNIVDDLSPILEDLRELMGYIFGSLIYFGSISSGIYGF